MHVTIGEKRFDFQKIDINVLETGIQNAFAKFDKMTLSQLLTKKKYTHLKQHTEMNFGTLLSLPAGEALLEMKVRGDMFYKQFLNNYGDMVYSRFVAAKQQELSQKKGVYTIIVNNELVFAGVCATSFKERFNQHIGNISAKGCFKDGTATHCHINARLTEAMKLCKAHFSICPMLETKEMTALKNAIIMRFEPVWNLRVGKELDYSYNY
ncbi:hypothetical protein [Solibacillus sp. CAU 1738]|uniref:hypothetical protein n=1 Tax=Solibacillus sp. CAU 1738 TaxID=3140363 RepID=UPI0032604CE3